MDDAGETGAAPVSESAGLSNRALIALTVASAIVVANAYYIHPIIALVADHFGVSDAAVGAAPAFNQIALAIGVFLLLPLGDRFGNRMLAALFTAGQCAALILMVFAQGFALFVTASTLLGFFTITPYLLPAYVSKRVAPGRLGYATAVLTTGIIIGILLARTGAGVVGEFYGWRTVYVVAAVLMAGMGVMLPLVMEGPRADKTPPARESYFKLLASTLILAARFPRVILSGVIQGLSFGIFLSVWMGLGLHLTSEAMGYGADVVGYLAALSIVNMITTPFLGRWADRTGARKARARLAVFQFAGVSTLLISGHSLWLLMIPITAMNITGPMIDVTGRMTFLDQAPETRTRLMTVYIMLMFIGGGVASWAGTVAYDYAGWMGNAWLAVSACAGVLAFCLIGAREGGA